MPRRIQRKRTKGWRIPPFLALHEVTLRQGWEGSADNPGIRSTFGHGVFCRECVGSLTIAAPSRSPR